MKHLITLVDFVLLQLDLLPNGCHLRIEVSDLLLLVAFHGSCGTADAFGLHADGCHFVATLLQELAELVDVSFYAT